MHIKKQSNIKTFFIVLAALPMFFIIPLVPFAVPLLIIYILFSPPGLDREARAQLNRDSKHAVEDAMAYLDEKYHMDYELNTFEPEIIKPADLDRLYSGWYYDSTWKGEFTVDGNKYEIYSFIDRNWFGDNYQTSQIFSAYEELVMQYFPDTYEDNDTVYDVEYKIVFWDQGFYRYGCFSTYYDGTNLEELLLENGILIRINIDDDVSMSDEFWLECEEALANMEKDYEGAYFGIINRKEEE